MAIGIFGLIPSSSPDELRKILDKLSTKWGDVVEDFESLEVKPMKGAMTNEVFMVSWPRKETKFGSRKLLVRIYGEGVDVFFNRDDEIRTFEFVARQGHGPTLLGRFPGGRVEEFIHARTLSATDLRDPNISGLVALSRGKFMRLLDFVQDYEYASYNPIAYDIANHFCEMVAKYHSDTPHILDYTLYPGEEERRRYICNYLTYSGEEPREEDIEQLLDETEKYTLASHLFWGLWGIISGYVNKIEFDYVEYSRQRFKQYWLRKPQLLSFYPSS
ncbi:PREDICTED: probable choline kinase 3 [Camelina sativa]|uniref:Probable choline kinase 3 n=1 Tax=Camelina sativa TaxID=90675 RepID=A0ABM1QC17_CAMSA|nr:PREDICTED: probable choline kinase 3 [Camelina sativa]